MFFRRDLYLFWGLDEVGVLGWGDCVSVVFRIALWVRFAVRRSVFNCCYSVRGGWGGFR